MKKILIVEDSGQDLKKIKRDLKSNDLTIYDAPNIKTALKILQDQIIDVLVLDRVLINVGQNNEDGLTICQKIKENPKKYRNPFIIVLSRFADNDEKKKGFISGINAYFDKKFEFELCICAIISEFKSKIFINNVMKYGDLILDIEDSVVKLKGVEIEVNNSEYAILVELLKHQEIWMQKEELKKLCWGQNNLVTDNFFHTNICRLRQKIKIIDENLISKRFQGYFLKGVE